MFDPISIMLITAGLGFGAGVVCTLFWDEIKSILQKLKFKIICTIQKMGKFIIDTTISLKNAIVTAVLKNRQFLIKVRQFFYSKQQEKWGEIIETSSISQSEVPEHLLNKVKAKSSEVDISDDIRQELSLEY